LALGLERVARSGAFRCVERAAERGRRLLALADVDEHARVIERRRTLADRAIVTARRGPALLERGGLRRRWWRRLHLGPRSRRALHRRRTPSTAGDQDESSTYQGPKPNELTHR